MKKREEDDMLLCLMAFMSSHMNSLVMGIISGSKYLPQATVIATGTLSVAAQLQSLLQAGRSGEVL